MARDDVERELVQMGQRCKRLERALAVRERELKSATVAASAVADKAQEREKRIAQLERALAAREKELGEARKTIEKHEGTFVRIAKAVGVNSPLILIAEAKNNEESFADILAGIIERNAVQEAGEGEK